MKSEKVMATAASLTGTQFSAGPPHGKLAPSGGSAVREATSVGARKKIALFDLDHTLIPIDSDYEWGEFTIALGWCDATPNFLRITGPERSTFMTMCALPRRPFANKALLNQ